MIMSIDRHLEQTETKQSRQLNINELQQHNIFDLVKSLHMKYKQRVKIEIDKKIFCNKMNYKENQYKDECKNFK